MAFGIDQLRPAVEGVLLPFQALALWQARRDRT